MSCYNLAGRRGGCDVWTQPSFVPHHQMRVFRFLRAVLSSSCSSSSTSSRSMWAPPDFNHECQLAVGTTTPQPRAQDRSGHHRISTASVGVQCSAVGTTGPQPWGLDRSGHRWSSTARARSQWVMPDLNETEGMLEYRIHVK